MQTCAAHHVGLGAICIPRRDPAFQEEAGSDPPHGPSSGQRSKGACLTGRLVPELRPGVNE